MKDNITLIVLHGHKASDEAKKDIDFWFRHNSMVNVGYVVINSNAEMKMAKKEHKFIDLPCLVAQDGKKTFKFYGEGIDTEVSRLIEKWKHIKRGK